ncbi:MAG TPA: hypothetical protein VL614_02890 [Acetobacteraceae bacterium]|jgi:hypothetical protein|nr:hypothetical protein [Acetobacteraceae bacterium]
MSDAPTIIAGRSSVLLQLNAAIYRDIVYRLHKELPPPDTSDPDLIDQIIEAAIADIASMLPANGDEARIAVRTVVADARADECARHARGLTNDYAAAMKCLAQANHFTRTANASRALLHRVQAARRKHEADLANCQKDAWTEEAVISSLAEAHRNTRKPAPPPPAPASSEEDPFAAYTEAERYAILHPDRAAGIRAHGGIPPGASYECPTPTLLADILASTSDILQQIDEQFAHTLAA